MNKLKKYKAMPYGVIETLGFIIQKYKTLFFVIGIIGASNIPCLAQTDDSLLSFTDTSTNIRMAIEALDAKFETINDEEENGNKANFKRWKIFGRIG